MTELAGDINATAPQNARRQRPEALIPINDEEADDDFKDF